MSEKSLKSRKIPKNGGNFQTFLVLRVGAFCENGKMGAETPFIFWPKLPFLGSGAENWGLV
ncbi:hypothetical protein [Bartonella sp. AC53GZZY]|uniref:hypothetical protein n=1 Tax=Bartonella sp. AC53GZZY TaxID=3243456 RepID=UPI0035CEC037